MKFTGRFIVVIWAIFKGVYSQPILRSSASENFMCSGSLISFFCNATSTELFWLMDKVLILSFPAFNNVPVLRYRSSDIYSSLLPSSTSGVLISELVFYSAPETQSFTVGCSIGGDSTTSLTTTILGGASPPTNVRGSISDSVSVNVSWEHSLSERIRHFEILLGTVSYLVNNTTRNKTVLLPECTESMTLQVIAVDHCGNRDPSNVTRMSCLTTTMFSTSATTSGSTLLDCTNGTSQLLESVDNTITQTEAQVTKTYITVIFILIIVILHFIIFSICQIWKYIYIKKEKNSSLAPTKEEMSLHMQGSVTKTPIN